MGKSNERSRKKSDEKLMRTNAGKQEQKEGGGAYKNTSSIMSFLGYLHTMPQY